MSDLDFASLLCSRLCHDLVSPVGALANGLEILAEEHDDAMREQVMALLDQSARQTSNRLQFFRLAFGAAGGFGQEVDPAEARKALEAFFDANRVTIQWDITRPSLDKRLVKLLLNMALLAGEAMIRGGTLIIDLQEGGGQYTLAVTAKADRFVFADGARDALVGRLAVDQLEPRSAPAYLAHSVAEDLSGHLSLDTAEEGTYRFLAQMPVPAAA